MRERRRHEEVLARDVQVHQLHDGEVLEVLLRHERDGDVEDVELVLLAEVQEQIERALERWQRYRVRISRAARGCGRGACALHVTHGVALIPGLYFRHDRPRLEEPRRGFKGQRPCP